jgi:hypothetical protein
VTFYFLKHINKHSNEENTIYLKTTICYPLSKADEVGRKFLVVSEKRPDNTSLGDIIARAAVKSVDEGIEVFSLLKVNNGKMDDAYNDAGQRMIEYRSIEGFSYTIETYFEVEEAMALIGLGG